MKWRYLGIIHLFNRRFTRFPHFPARLSFNRPDRFLVSILISAPRRVLLFQRGLSLREFACKHAASQV